MNYSLLNIFNNKNYLHQFILSSLVILVYYLLVKSGLFLSYSDTKISFFWPAAGFAFGMTAIFGTKILILIFIGAFLTTFMGYTSNVLDIDIVKIIILSLSSGFGICMGSYVGFKLLSKYIEPIRCFNSFNGALKFILFAGFVGQSVNSSLAIFIYYFLGFIDSSTIFFDWFNWFSGDVLGVIIISPLIIISANKDKLKFNTTEAIAFIIILSIVSLYCLDLLLVNKPVYLSIFFVGPLLIWGAARAGQKLTFLGIVIVSVFSIFATLNNIGPFAKNNLILSLVELQSFLFVISIMSIFFSTLLIEYNTKQYELMESEKKLRLIIGNMGEGLIGTDNFGNITYTNEKIGKILDIKNKDELENSLKKLLTENNDSINNDFDSANINSQNIEYTKFDQSKIWLDINKSTIINESNEEDGNIFLIRDNTEKEIFLRKNKTLEEQLIQSQKLESIGQLAGGIAHDFNNILTSIIGYGELLLINFATEKPEKTKGIKVILKQAKKAANLTTKLLGFAREGKYDPVVLNINSLIKNVVDVTESIFEKNTKINYNLDQSIKYINADKSQLDQVITNLIINAKDAFVDKGELTFSTSNILMTNEFSSKYDLHNKNGYIKLIISDNGSGIKPEIISKIFEPFFTTKEIGKGTGLGLSMVYGILQNHEGKILCESELGVGTKFTIFLPAIEYGTIVETKESPKPLKGSGNILVIDDEIDIREILRIQLESLGYKVITANDGESGLKLFNEYKNDIDLVLLDIIMPNLSGDKTFYKLKEIDSNVKVIILSGYGSEDRINALLNEGVLDFLQKPMRIAKLSKALNDILKISN